MKNLFAKSGPDWTTLIDHLNHVSVATIKFAEFLGLNVNIAHKGAILHDIGKVHPEFQKRLIGNTKPTKVFRHEISSLFFISLFPENEQSALIEMVVGHHKSIKNDIGDKGLLDLDDKVDGYEKFHLDEWDIWSIKALEVFNYFGIETKNISKIEAINNLEKVVNYCKTQIKTKGFSEWRGLLIGADHFASAMINETEKEINLCFKKPILNFFNRRDSLYPLSLKSSNSTKKHSLVVACTGAGKTDFLFRRCNGRVFYTLPFQASINAMFKRVAKDLQIDNPNFDIRVLHSSSSVILRHESENEAELQSLFGSSIKILTPYQLASLVFGLKGFEVLILDLKGCDIIIDEIHTYSGISQSIVIKLVEILKQIGCNIHIGTATLPSILYNKILDILENEVLEISLSTEELDKFDRHKVFKINSFEESFSILNQAVNEDKKILIVLNRVTKAQKVYDEICELYPKIPKLLLHSRFKRGDRNEKERQLIGLNDDGSSLSQFNTSFGACIVVSTQIVEVSLDISFDTMVTECAPLDALAQRFGRINRKRTNENIGKLKDVYVIAPPLYKQKALPYDLGILNSSFNELVNGETFRERDLQSKIDRVYTSINFLDIEEHSIFKSDGRISINKLTHRSKSILFELLEIDSVSCICESDKDEYENSGLEKRLELEIPIRFNKVKEMSQSQKGNKPFIIPDKSYSKEKGLVESLIKVENFNINNRIL